MHRPYRGHGLLEARASDQRGRPVLRFRVQVMLVECEHLAAAHENPAVGDDGVGTAAVCTIDQVGNRIVNGCYSGRMMSSGVTSDFLPTSSEPRSPIVDRGIELLPL